MTSDYYLFIDLVTIGCMKNACEIASSNVEGIRKERSNFDEAGEMEWSVEKKRVGRKLRWRVRRKSNN